jgi:hypothetical protein
MENTPRRPVFSPRAAKFVKVGQKNQENLQKSTVPSPLRWRRARPGTGTRGASLGQANHETGATELARFVADLAAVLFDDAFDDGKSEASA